MNERCLRVVISGPGEQQVQLRLPGASSEQQVVVQVASLGAHAPARRDGLTGAAPLGSALLGGPSPTQAISLELRWSEPAPALAEPTPRSEPAPLATAWAMAQRLRQRQSSSPPARRRTVRDPAG